MPTSQSAKTLAITVIAAGGIVLLHAGTYWTGQPMLTAVYVLLAALASTLKLRLPGVPGTFSANCFVTVLAIARLSLGQLVFVSVACALVQSCWRASKQPTTVQVLFNAAVFAISAAASGWAYAALERFVPSFPATAGLVAASCVFFVINTGAVSAVVALSDSVSAIRLWRVMHLPFLPYYLINVALAVLVTAIAPASVLLVIACAVPLMLGSFAAYRFAMRKAAPAVARIS